MAESNIQWKQKYYAGLDDLEQREKDWKEQENLFKQAISRLTLAAEGNNKSLDSSLKQLRTAIRTDKDNHFIESILKNIYSEIIELDKQEKSAPAGDAGFLLKIIEQMQLQGKAEKKSRSLVKQIAKQIQSKNPPQQKQLLKIFTELLSEVVKQSIIDNDKEHNNGKTGFVRNFFSSAKKPSAEIEPSADREPLASEEPSAGEEPSADKESSTGKEPSALLIDETSVIEADSSDHKKQDINLNQQQMSSVVHTVQNVLESIIDCLDLTDEVKESLTNKLIEIKPTKEIHILLDDLKEIFEDASMVDSSLIERNCNDGEHHDLLIRLIEYLPLDESIKDKAEQLKENFSHGVNTEQLPGALKSIAELINKMQSDVQQEQKEFELFLKNLTGHIKSVDQYLDNNFNENKKSHQEGIELDNVVKQQVNGIADSVASIDNLETIETAVQNHLGQIVTHLNTHRVKEDKRAVLIEAQNKQLSEQIKLLESESSSLRQQVLESTNKALTDPLTQLPNRLAYNQRLKQEYARWKRYNNTLLLMIWDIDFFKKVNDNYGHQAGDKVLKVVAEMLQKNIRETDFISRFGGEEFVSIMPETSLGGGFIIAEKIRAVVEKLEFQYHGSNVKVTISCGITLFMENDTPEIAFERADKALYQAKEQGRNRCVIAQGGLA